MIKDFFRWWITDSNGKEYMTLIECSLGDWVWIALTITSLMVVWIYSKIGIHSLERSKKYPDGVTKSYLVEKTHVFVFCAVAGYLMVAISSFLNPYKLRVLLNLILFFWAYKFYKSVKSSGSIESIYENERRIKEIDNQITIAKESAKKIRLKVNKEINNNSQFIDFKTIKDSFPVGSKQSLGEGKLIQGLDYYENDKIEVILLRGHMPEGTSYSWNDHDCEEYIFPIEGKADETKADLPFMFLQMHKIGIKVVHGFDALKPFDFYSILIKYKE